MTVTYQVFVCQAKVGAVTIDPVLSSRVGIRLCPGSHSWWKNQLSEVDEISALSFSTAASSNVYSKSSGEKLGISSLLCALNNTRLCTATLPLLQLQDRSSSVANRLSLTPSRLRGCSPLTWSHPSVRLHLTYSVRIRACLPGVILQQERTDCNPTLSLSSVWAQFRKKSSNQAITFFFCNCS